MIEIPNSVEFSGLKKDEAAELFRAGLAEKARRSQPTEGAVLIPLPTEAMAALVKLAEMEQMEFSAYLRRALLGHVWSWRNYLETSGISIPDDFGVGR
jgi:hypothetical protein